MKEKIAIWLLKLAIKRYSRISKHFYKLLKTIKNKKITPEEKTKLAKKFIAIARVNENKANKLQRILNIYHAY